MEDPFVWFDLRSKDAVKTRALCEELFGWEISEVPAGGPTVTMIGGDRPWASLVNDGGSQLGWFPYVPVDDLQWATTKAQKLGATVLHAPTDGPAGTYTPIREPGGALLALFRARS